MKYTLFIVLVASALVGCGSPSTELSAEEQKAFKGGGSKTSQPRSDTAKQGIADFQKDFEARHGAKSAPSQASPNNAGNTVSRGSSL